MKLVPAANGAGPVDCGGARRGALASCGSAESEQSRLAQAVLPGSTASVDDSLPALPATTAAAAARAAQPAAGTTEGIGCPASAQPAELLALPGPYLSELAAANECLKGLPLPGAPSHQQHQKGASGTALHQQGAQLLPAVPCTAHHPALLPGCLACRRPAIPCGAPQLRPAAAAGRVW